MTKRLPHRERKQYEHGYGHFPGGDPRLFSPDEESCLPDELEAHRLACEAWDRGDRKPVLSAYEPAEGQPTSEHLASLTNGGVPICIIYQRFGIGTYQIRVPIESRKQRLKSWREFKQRMQTEHGATDAEISEARRGWFPRRRRAR